MSPAQRAQFQARLDKVAAERLVALPVPVKTISLAEAKVLYPPKAGTLTPVATPTDWLALGKAVAMVDAQPVPTKGRQVGPTTPAAKRKAGKEWGAALAQAAGLKPDTKSGTALLVSPKVFKQLKADPVLQPVEPALRSGVVRKNVTDKPTHVGRVATMSDAETGNAARCKRARQTKGEAGKKAEADRKRASRAKKA